MHQQQKRRKGDRPYGVDVLQRIEGDAPELPGRVIATALRNIAMRRLMQRNRQ